MRGEYEREFEEETILASKNIARLEEVTQEIRIRNLIDPVRVEQYLNEITDVLDLDKE